MKTIQEHIDFVNSQIRFHEERAEHFSSHKFRKNKHIETAENFKSLAEYLNSRLDRALAAPKQLSLSLSPQDIENLPEELLQELSISEADKAEFALLQIMEENEGIMSLDQILIAYYKSQGEVVKRTAMTNKLYRMANKGLIVSAPNKKGIYCLKSIPDEEIERLFST